MEKRTEAQKEKNSNIKTQENVAGGRRSNNRGGVRRKNAMVGRKKYEKKKLQKKEPEPSSREKEWGKCSGYKTRG